MQQNEISPEANRGEIATLVWEIMDVAKRVENLDSLVVTASNARGPFAPEELGKLADVEEFLRKTVPKLRKAALELSLIAHPRGPEPRKESWE